MKLSILLLAFIVAAFSSCTTAYKTGQTPDDVYYSPERPQEEYVRTEKRDNRRYISEDEYYDNRYLRMKVNNRYRWNDLNDWYSYERYGSGYNYVYGSYNNPYNSWNYYYNPYCTQTVVVNPKNTTAVNNTPRTFNLNTYNNISTVRNNYNSNYKTSNSNRNNNNTYTSPGNDSRNSNSNSGSVLRNIFGSSNSNSSSNNSTNSSSGNTNSGSSGSSSSSSGSSAPVRKF